jgi:hypothetical protein
MTAIGAIPFWRSSSLEFTGMIRLIWYVGLAEFLIVGWLVVSRGPKALYEIFSGFAWGIVISLAIGCLFRFTTELNPIFDVILSWPAIISGVAILICNFLAPFFRPVEEIAAKKTQEMEEFMNEKNTKQSHETNCSKIN